MTDYPPGPGGPDDYDPTGPDHQWVDAPDESQYQELPPLEDEAPAKRKLLTRGRIVAAAAALVLVVGGAGFALSQGGGDDNNNDGIASLDGSGNNSSNGSGSGSGNGKPSSAEVQDAALKYAQCMRDHGVPMKDPKVSADGGLQMTVGADGKPGEGGPGSAAQKKMETADKACKHFMDAVAPEQNMSPQQVAEEQDKQTKLAECMRGKGYDFADPKVDDQGRVTSKMNGKPGQGGNPQDNDKFNKDMETCSKKAGLRGGPRGGGGDGSSTQKGNT